MGVHQTFTLAQSSTVTSVSFAAKLQPPTDSLYVSVGRPGQAPIGWFYSSADTPGGAIDGVTVTSGAVFDQVQVPLAAPGNAGLRLTAGSYEIFWENYRSDMPYFLVTGDFVTASNPINAYGFADSSLAFSIQGVSAVPEVGAGWLMASGLGLLALLGARRRSGASC